MFSNHDAKNTNTIKAQQMDLIIESILQGKYSSACLLLLEAVGHNPLHYMPYRTYNRLQKQRKQADSTHLVGSPPKIAHLSAPYKKLDLNDLDYIESATDPTSAVGGNINRGRLFLWPKKNNIAIKICQTGIATSAAIDRLNSVPPMRTLP